MSTAQVLILRTVWAVAARTGATGQGSAGVWGPASRRSARSACSATEQEMREEASTPAVGDVAFYRRYTEGILRRYLRLSMEVGRVPSVLGGTLFRGGRVTNYRMRSFDDVVIFVHDVERCVERLTPRQQALIERIGLQEHTQGDVAEMLGMSLRSVNRRYADAVDVLSGMFLASGLLEPVLECQELTA